MSRAFYEEGSKFLTPSAFEFVLESEMKRAVRRQNYVTLVLVEASREWEGVSIAADDGTLREVGQVLGKEIRDTDLLGHAGKGALAVVLLDTDFDQSASVIDRLITRIEDYDFQTTLRIAVGAACYPTHAVDVDSLKREASSRAVVNWRRGTRSSPHKPRQDHHEIQSDRLVSDGSCHSRLRHPMMAGQDVSPRPPAIAPPVEKKPNPDASRAAAGRPTALAEYRIGNGDKLRVEVYKDQQLSQSVQVRPDGRITLPLVGDLDAADQTPVELRDTITTALKAYVTNPTVTVIVVEATAAIAYVMGEVNHPGAVTLQGGPLTVLQALAMAGGFKDFADINNIRVLRRTPSGVQTITFNYKDAIRGAPPVYLRTGDTVVVPD